MTLEEHELTDNWSNEDYFDYMKETGEWEEHGSMGHTGKPCDRCGHSEQESWIVESFIDVVDSGTLSYIVGTEFEICSLCMLELFGATYPVGIEAD